MSDPTGLSPTRLFPSHFEYRLKRVGPQLLTASVQFGYTAEICMTPSSGLSNLLAWLQSPRKHLTLISFSEDALKGTHEQPDEETGRAKSGSIPNTGAPVPVELECYSSSGCVFVYLEAPQP